MFLNGTKFFKQFFVVSILFFVIPILLNHLTKYIITFPKTE